VIRCFLFLIILPLAAIHATAKPSSHSKPLTVGLIDGGRPPYYWKSDNGNLTGLYIDLLKLIEDRSSLSFTFKSTPQSRIRLRMISGNLDIEPGIDPIWRQELGEQENSSYSMPFMASEEAWVYSKHHELSKLNHKEIEKLKPCSVHGFNVTDIQKKPEREVKALSELQILRLIELDRCDYAIMPLDVFSYLSNNTSFHVHMTRPHVSYQLSFRINKQHIDILPELNKALAALINNGSVERLVIKYTTPEGSHDTP